MAGDFARDAFFLLAKKNPEFKNLNNSQLNQIYNNWLINSGTKAKRTIQDGTKALEGIIQNKINKGTALKGPTKHSAGLQQILSEAKLGKVTTAQDIDNIAEQLTQKLLGRGTIKNSIPTKYKNISNVSKNIINTPVKSTVQFGKLGGLPMALLLDAVLRNPTNIGKDKGTMFQQLGWNIADLLLNKNKQQQNNKVDLSKGDNQPYTNEDQGIDYTDEQWLKEIDRRLNYTPENINQLGNLIDGLANKDYSIKENRFDLEPLESIEDLNKVSINQSQPIQVAQQQQQVQQNNISNILDQYKKYIEELNAPQINALEQLIKYYPQLAIESARRQQYYTALAGLSGNQGYKDLASAYDPLSIATNRINLLSQLQKAKVGNMDQLNELTGNAALMRQLGIPEEASMANKDMLKAYAQLKQYENMLEGKKYAADLGLLGNEYTADKGLLGKKYVADRSYGAAIDRQALANQARLLNGLLSGTSNIYAMGNDPSGYIDIANQLTGRKLKLTPQEQAGLNPTGTGLNSNYQQQAIDRLYNLR